MPIVQCKFNVTGRLVRQVPSKFGVYKRVSAQTTMEYVVGKPTQLGLTTLAADRWTSMYPS